MMWTPLYRNTISNILGTFGSPKIAKHVYFGLIGTWEREWEHAWGHGNVCGNLFGNVFGDMGTCSKVHVQLVSHGYENKELW